ncbi:MAG TPA: DUF4402 domain-containing protein [Gammaproteobacteria bacterium]
MMKTGTKTSAVVRSLLVGFCIVAPARVALNASVISTQEIAFGAIVSSGTSGGTVTVTPAGSRSCSLGLTCIPQSVAHPARFSVSGDPFMNFVISLPVTATLASGGGSSMDVDGFEVSLPGGSGTLSSTGQASFTVGAMLHVEPGQPADAYSGTFTVMVGYQ